MKVSYTEIADVVKKQYGFDLSVYESAFLSKTITRQMKLAGLHEVSDYVTLLNNKSEAKLLIASLNNSYTEFFRDPLVFGLFEKRVLPELFERNKNKKNGEIRMWSAACSTGEEAYSLAIVCDEACENQNQKARHRIFATDKSSEVIQRALIGRYSQTALAQVTFKRLLTHFERSDDFFLIAESLKKTVDFSVYDLLDENSFSPPASIFGHFDVVFLSNVLFYYREDMRRKILLKVTNSLAKGGYLIVGEAEKQIVEEINAYICCFGSSIFKKV